MKILNIKTQPDYSLVISTSDGRCGLFDVTPYLGCEAFAPLKEPAEFEKGRNGGYFIEWDCGADLSADTLEARMIELRENSSSSFQTTAAEKVGPGNTPPLAP
jgi:hypothetical protein